VCAANWSGWQPDINTWAIVLGDQPHLKPETLRALLAFYRENPGTICQPASDGHRRHPVLLPRRAFDELKNSPADTLQNFLKLSSCPRVLFSVNDSSLALDLDTPEDYHKMVTAQPSRT
jgi:molybdenum cofactor cytidylyltransferase